MVKFCTYAAECTGGGDEPPLPGAQQANTQTAPLEGVSTGEAPIADAFMLQALRGFDQVPLLLRPAALLRLHCDCEQVHSYYSTGLFNWLGTRSCLVSGICYQPGW